MFHIKPQYLVSLLVGIAIPRAVQAQTVGDVATGDAELSTLLTYVNAAGVYEDLTEEGVELTLFAPTNDAFDAVDQGLAAQLLTEPWGLHLVTLMGLHIIGDDTILSTDLEDGAVVESLLGEELTINVDAASGAVTITSPGAEGSMVVEADLTASNGVIHKVSGVLLPSWANTDILGLADVVEGFTVLNGLLQASGLASQIPPGITATILAPIDEAFEALGEECVAFYQNPDNQAALIALLTNHVLLEMVPTTILSDGESKSTVGGSSITFGIQGEEDEEIYTINDTTTIVIANNLANNGIVHAIDTVLGAACPGGVDEPTASPADVVDEPTASPADVVDGPTAMPKDVVDEPTASPADVVDGPTATPADIVDGPTAMPADVVDPGTMPSDLPSSIPAVVDDMPTNMPAPISDEPTLSTIVASEEDLSTLSDALMTAGFSGKPVDADYVIFAPIDAAFGALDQEFLAKLLTPDWILHLRNILDYHIAGPTDVRLVSSVLVDDTMLTMDNGEDITISVVENDPATTAQVDPVSVSIITPGNPNGTAVVEADLEAANGVLHKIDEVLLPSFLTVDLSSIQEQEIAQDFTILFEVFNSVGGASVIPPGEYTVLAPTDDAFAKMGDDFVEKFKTDAVFAAPILLNHVFQKVYPSVNLEDGQTIMALGGKSFTVSVSDEAIKVDDATVVIPNYLLSIGIIHGIDTVLAVPEDGTPAPAGGPSDTEPTMAPVMSGEPATMAPVEDPSDRDTSASFGVSYSSFIFAPIVVAISALF